MTAIAVGCFPAGTRKLVRGDGKMGSVKEMLEAKNNKHNATIYLIECPSQSQDLL